MVSDDENMAISAQLGHLSREIGEVKVMVGGLREDVKTLCDKDKTQDDEIAYLRRGYYMAIGAMSLITLIVTSGIFFYFLEVV